MYQPTQQLNKITLELALDSLIRKSRRMTQTILENGYLEYVEEVETYHQGMSPVDFLEWVRIVVCHGRLNDSEEILQEEESEWLQRELDQLEIPTWRDVLTGDRALDSEGECPESPQLQEERVRISCQEPWMPDQNLFTIETSIDTTEEFTDVSEDEYESAIDWTEEINLNDMIY